MRRLVLSVMAAAALAGSARAQTVVVGVGGQLSQLPGEVVLAPIYVDMTNAGGELLGSFTVRVAWNPDSLYYLRTEPGVFATPIVNADSAYAGVLRVAGIMPDGLGGRFDVARLAFETPYFTTATTAVDLTVTELSAAGTLTDLLATATVTVLDGTFCSAVGRWGDVDGDGMANGRDALIILSAAVGIDVTGYGMPLGDVDGDAVTNTRDALILLSYAVGLDIAGQRVLLVAPGACAAGGVPTLAVVPDTADVVVGQAVRLLALASDGSGVPTAVTGVNWRVDDPDVASVGADGVLTGRQPGATVVRAGIGPGVEISGTVVVSDRRPVWYVDGPTATQRPVQLGTARYPFASIEYTFPLLREGDTVRVAPGAHDYEPDVYIDAPPFAAPPVGAPGYAGPLAVGAVFIGDTLPDGTRPIIRAAEGNYFTAFDWTGGVRGEVRNLEFQGFSVVVEGTGIQTLMLDNVRIVEPRTRAGNGVYLYTPVDTLLVSRAEFVGDSLGATGYPVYVDNGAGVVTVQDSRFENWGTQCIYGVDVDSLDVRRTEFVSSWGAIYLYASQSPDVAVRLEQSRVVTPRGGQPVYVYRARSVTMAGNYLEALTDDGVEVYGPSPFDGTVFRSTGDSILFAADDYTWLDASEFDSVLVDNLWLDMPFDSTMYQYAYVAANYVEFTNSRLAGLTGGYGLDIAAREIVVDNTQFLGCSTCGPVYGATALWLSAYLDRGPRLTLTNSTFSRLGEAVWHTGAGDSAGPATIANNVVDSVSSGFRFRADSSLVENNTLTRVRDYGIYSEPTYSAGIPPARTVVRGNEVTCSVNASYTSYGIYAYYIAGTFDDNVVTDCDDGIYQYYYPTAGYPLADLHLRGNTIFLPADGSGSYAVYALGRFGYGQVSGNTVRRGVYGLHLLPDLLAGDTSFFRVDSNAVSQTTATAVTLSPADSLDFVGVRNNISSNGQDGVFSSGSGLRSLTLGQFVGNARWAINRASGTVDATQNWWGSIDGAGGVNGSGLSDADSVSSALVDVSAFLGAAPIDLPPLGPPAAAAGYGASAVIVGTAEPPSNSIEEYERARAAEHAAALERRARRAADEAAQREALHRELDRLRQERRARRPN